MRDTTTAIVGMGIVAMVFMAVMSAVYLGNAPGKAEMDQLRTELETIHSMYLSPTHALTVRLSRPGDDDEQLGLTISCALRPDLAKDERLAVRYLRNIAVTVYEHPDWVDVLDFVSVSHVGRYPRSKTFPVPKTAPAQ